MTGSRDHRRVVESSSDSGELDKANTGERNPEMPEKIRCAIRNNRPPRFYWLTGASSESASDPAWSSCGGHLAGNRYVSGENGNCIVNDRLSWKHGSPEQGDLECLNRYFRGGRVVDLWKWTRSLDRKSSDYRRKRKLSKSVFEKNPPQKSLSKHA